MKLNLSDAAREQILQALSTRPHMKGIRLLVKKTGCSGYAYGLEFAERFDETTDSVCTVDSISFIYDQRHILFLDGMTIDFKRQGLQTGFSLEHPQATDRCGCGESFKFDAS